MKEAAPDLRADQLINLFVQSRAQRGRSHETIRTYQEVLCGLFKASLNDVLDESLLVERILGYVYDDQVASATQLKRYGHIRTFIRWALRNNHMVNDPLVAVEQPQRGQVLPKALSQDDVRLICDVMLEDYQRKRALQHVVKGDIVWRIPMFEFAFYTGMRASELARIRKADIDCELRLVRIMKQKNGHQQTIPLSSSALRVILPLMGGNEQEYVFHSPRGSLLERSSKRFAERSSAAFRYYRRAAGLPEGISFHSLRHGFCTALANAGKPGYMIKVAARHKDISTSMRYVHVSHRKLLSELDDVFE